MQYQYNPKLRTVKFSISFSPIFSGPSFFQLQEKALPHQAADHLDSDCVPQRSLEHAAAHDMERHQPVAPAAAEGNHPGGRCQRAGPPWPTAGGLRPDAARAHVRAENWKTVRTDPG